MKELIGIEEVEVRKGSNYRLKNITLRINQGDKIALLGKSGSGKSSLISVVNGSLKPTKGVTKWKGQEFRHLKSRHRRDIATLWQDLRLIEELDIEQNINAGALGRHNLAWAISNLLGIVKSSKSISCLKAAGLSRDLIHCSISQISGGQRQRVAIARLLRQESELILADEPLSNLDPKISLDILDLLLNQKQINSIKIPDTYLISLHRPDLINNFNRIIALYEGQIVIDLPTTSLKTNDLIDIYK